MDKFKNIQWLSSIDVYLNITTWSTPREFLEVHNVHGPRSHQAITRVEMYPTKSIDKQTSNKPSEIWCKIKKGACVNVRLLTTYQLVKPSEFNEQGKPIGGYGKDRTIIKVTMAIPSISMV